MSSKILQLEVEIDRLENELKIKQELKEDKKEI